MKRSTRWAIFISTFLIGSFVALLIFVYTLQAPSDFRQVRKGMTHEEAEILLGEPYIAARREQPDTLKIVRKPDDLGEIVEKEIGLTPVAHAKTAMGQSYQLWDRDEGGILVIFAEDGTVLDKEYRRKKVSFWQRLFDLIW
jgi:hypothetical protein